MNSPQPLSLDTYDFLRNRGQRVASIASIYGFRTVDAMVDHLVSLAARPLPEVTGVDATEPEPEIAPEPDPAPAPVEEPACVAERSPQLGMIDAPAPSKLEGISVEAAMIGELAGYGFEAVQAQLASLPVECLPAPAAGAADEPDCPSTAAEPTPPTSVAMAAIAGPQDEQPAVPASRPSKDRGAPATARRRFTEHAKLNPDHAAAALAPDHPALAESRTLFPSMVVPADAAPRLLISGHNSRKIGDRVTRGPWAGMPIFTLTLEERATCPPSCGLLDACYGNAMPFARRHAHGPELVIRLGQELHDLSSAYQAGFVIRLHVLGDFWSVEYVEFWRRALAEYPALRVFGYTAWERGTPIGDAVHRLATEQWDRFAVRQSVAPDAALCAAQATTIWRMPEGQRVAEGYVCPAQTGRTECCGTCGICWAPGARYTRIVFVGHGMARRGGGRKRADTAITKELLERLLVRDRLTYVEAARFLDSTSARVARLSRGFGIKLKPGRKPRVTGAAPLPERLSDEVVSSTAPAVEPAAVAAEPVVREPEPAALPAPSVWDKPVTKSQRIRDLLAEGHSRKDIALAVGVTDSFVAAIVSQDRKRTQRNAAVAAEPEPQYVEVEAEPAAGQAPTAEPAAEPAPLHVVLEQPADVPDVAAGDDDVRLPEGPAAQLDRSQPAAGAPVGRGGGRRPDAGVAARQVTKRAAPVGDLIAPAASKPRSAARPANPMPAPAAEPSAAHQPDVVQPEQDGPSYRRVDVQRYFPGSLGPAPRTCQWIEGEPAPDDSCKCGKPAVEGRPYCAHHLARAYVQGPERRKIEKGADWSAARIVGRSPR